MRGSLLRHRVTIQQKSGSGLDTRGQTTATWVDVQAGVPAAIRQLSGQEGLLARQVYPTATHKVSLRYRSDLTNQMRLVFGTRTLNIIDINRMDEIPDEMLVMVGEER